MVLMFSKNFEEQHDVARQRVDKVHPKRPACDKYIYMYFLKCSNTTNLKRNFRVNNTEWAFYETRLTGLPYDSYAYNGLIYNVE